MRALARLTWATRAASRSLSPKRISSVATVSFSLMIGTTPEFEQAVQGPLGVAVVAAAHQVVGGQQHLADAEAVRAERLGVAGDEQALADARGRLLGGQVARALLQAERRQPGGDRAGGDQQHLVAGAGPGGDRVGQRRDARRRRSRRSVVVSDEEPILTTVLGDPADVGAGQRCRRRSGRCTASSFQTPVRAARAGRVTAARREFRVPVEDDRVVAVADQHRVARLGARLGQGLLDAEPGQPVGQVADRLVVGEVGLVDPAVRLLAADQVRAVARCGRSRSRCP